MPNSIAHWTRWLQEWNEERMRKRRLDRFLRERDSAYASATFAMRFAMFSVALSLVSLVFSLLVKVGVFG
jgi:hypothetical protein